MRTRTVMTTVAATLAVGALGTASAGAETDEELDRAMAECEAAGGEMVIEENIYGEPEYICLGGTNDTICMPSPLQVEGDDDVWTCIYLDREVTVGDTRKPVTSTGGHGGPGTIHEPSRPATTFGSVPARRLG